MITLDTLNHWLIAPAEHEHLEFKEAKQTFDTTKLLRYCAALANEGGGHLVLGVADKSPRQVVGSTAFTSTADLNHMKEAILQKFRFRVETTDLHHPSGRVLVFTVPPRPLGQPIEFDGAYLMRSGESLTSMTPDKLKRIFAEGEPDWFSQAAKVDATADEIINLLDTQTYFELAKLPYPTTREGVLERLAGESLIIRAGQGWTITNVAAILLAKKLDAILPSLARKAPRVVIYEGANKNNTREDKPWRIQPRSA